VEGHEEKFGYFHSEGKAIPREGMLLEVLQYTTKQNGEYTNHDVKKLETGVSATPPTKAAQTATQAPKTAFVVRRDTKSIKIGFYACLKIAGTLQSSTLAQLIQDAKMIYAEADKFALTYRPSLTALQAKMDASGIPDTFWTWFIAANKVAEVSEIPEVSTAYALEHWMETAQRFIDSTIPQQDEDVQREQSFAEAIVQGPEETSFPADEKAPDPAQEELCPW